METKVYQLIISIFHKSLDLIISRILNNNNNNNNNTLQLRKSPENLSWEIVDEGSEISHHLKWGSFLPNGGGRIAQHIREEEGRKEGKDWDFRI